jgi:hypothetical protein
VFIKPFSGAAVSAYLISSGKDRKRTGAALGWMMMRSTGQPCIVAQVWCSSSPAPLDTRMTIGSNARPGDSGEVSRGRSGALPENTGFRHIPAIPEDGRSVDGHMLLIR